MSATPAPIHICHFIHIPHPTYITHPIHIAHCQPEFLRWCLNPDPPPPPLSTTLYLHQYRSIVAARGRPSVPLKNRQLVWNYQLPTKSNPSCKNFRNSKITKSFLTASVAYVALQLSSVLKIIKVQQITRLSKEKSN